VQSSGGGQARGVPLHVWPFQQDDQLVEDVDIVDFPVVMITKIITVGTVVLLNESIRLHMKLI
jgi:hypothetical protein